MGKGKNSQPTVVGYKVYLSVLYGLCHGPIDKIWNIWVEEKPLDVTETPKTVSVDKPALFNEYQGGISGQFEIREGNTTDAASSVIGNFVGSLNNAYRGIAALVLNNMYLGNSPYLKPWSVRVQRIFKRIVGDEVVDQWYLEKAACGPYSTVGISSAIRLAAIPDVTDIDENWCYDYENRRIYAHSRVNQIVYVIDMDTMETESELSTADLVSRGYGSYELIGRFKYGWFMFREDRPVPEVRWLIARRVDNILQFVHLGPEELNYWARAGYSAGNSELHCGRSIFRGPPIIIKLNNYGQPSDGITIFHNPLYAQGRTTESNHLYFPEVAHLYYSAQDSYTGQPGPSALAVASTTSEDYNYSADFPLESGSNASRCALIVKSPDEANTIYCVVSEGTFTSYNNDFDSSMQTYIHKATFSSASPRSITFVSKTLLTYATDTPVLFVSYFADQKLWVSDFNYNGFEVKNGAISVIYTGSNGTQYTALIDLKESRLTAISTVGGANPYVIHSADGYMWTDQDDFERIKGVTAISSSNIDMNPAHIIREILTDTEWGLGFGDADIDDTAFIAAADTLYDEGFGLSFAWGSQKPAEEIINLVLKHIDGVVYVDRTTGRFVLKLIRDDYGTPPVFDDTDIVEVVGYNVKPESELINSVTVIYNDREKRTTASLSVNDVASIRQFGSINPTTVTYSGVYDSDLASKIATRDLRTLSTPLISGELIINRKTSTDFNVGDVFTISSNLYPQISGITFRITELDFSSSEENEIGVQFVEDVFNIGTGFSSVEDDGVLKSLTYPPYVKAWEVDFYSYSRALGDQTVAENLAYEDLRSAGILFAGGSQNIAYPYEIYSTYTNSFTRLTNTNDGPVFSLDKYLSADPSDTAVDVTWLNGETIFEPNTLAYIGEELVEVVSVTGGVATLIRGMADTVPQGHEKGTIGYVWGQSNATHQGDLISGDSVEYFFNPVGDVNTIALTPYGAPTASITYTGRLDKPWPVNNLSYNGENYATEFAGVANVTWANQDKYLLTGATRPDYLDSTTGLEANTTNNITVVSYLFDGTALATEVSDTTTSESYSIDTDSFNASAEYAEVQVEVENTSNSKTNHQTANLILVNPETPRSAFDSVQYYDSAYYDTTFYTDVAKTTTLSPTDADVPVAALDTSTGTYTTDLSQSNVSSQPIYRDAGDSPFGVPYLDFSFAKSLEYTGSVTGSLYIYYIEPDGTFGDDSTTVISGVAKELTFFPETVYQFVLTHTQLSEAQRQVLRRHMEQGLVSTVTTWYDAGFWDDTDNWTE